MHFYNPESALSYCAVRHYFESASITVARNRSCALNANLKCHRDFKRTSLAGGRRTRINWNEKAAHSSSRRHVARKQKRVQHFHGWTCLNVWSHRNNSCWPATADGIKSAPPGSQREIPTYESQLLNTRFCRKKWQIVSDFPPHPMFPILHVCKWNEI